MNDLFADLDRCSRCGKCRTVCPVFDVTLDELKVARGRVALVKAMAEGNLAFSEKFEQALDTCLKCHRCEVNCPSETPTPELIIEAKARVAEKRGRSSFAKFVLNSIVAGRGRFDAALELAAAGQKLLPKRREGTLRHLPLFFGGRRRIPQLAAQSALQRFPETLEAKNQTGEVIIFTGCLGNYVEVETIAALVKILLAAGKTVHIPKGQLCCGLPARFLGEKKIAQSFAAKNIAELNRFDRSEAVLTTCATCASSVRDGWLRLVGSERYLKIPHRDAVEYVNALGIEWRKIDLPVTYHDPCHLKYGLGESRAGRELLAKTADFTETPGADLCCGGSGAFSWQHYDLSQKIGAKKAAAVKEAGIKKIATDCPGCIMQLNDILPDRFEALHVLEIAARALP